MILNAQIEVTYTLFKSDCMSLFGCVMWNLYTNGSSILVGRKCIRRLLKLSNMTHSKYLAPLCIDYPVNVQIYNRVLKLVNYCLYSNNQCVILCVNLALNGSSSNVCKNMNQIVCKCDKYSLLNRFDE